MDRPGQSDDAPLTTSKRSGADAEAAAAVGATQGSSAVGRAITIDKPAAELWAYFRDFSNLATFMENVVRIEVKDPKRSHWVVKAPAGRTVEWDAVVTDEAEGRFIAWEAENADVPNSGRVEFRDAGSRGTVVHATIVYDPPAGTVGKLIAKMFQREPNMQARQDLKRFKQVMETGEVTTRARNQREFAEEKN